jgi:DNA-binding NarL/FixJ family response regulator
MKGRPLRVVVADDHALIRDGLRRALERSSEAVVVGEAASIAELLEVMSSTDADALVVDIRFTDGNSLETVKSIVSANPMLAVVVISMYAGLLQVEEARSAGASAFVAKDAPTEDVVTMVLRAVDQPRAFVVSEYTVALQPGPERAPPLSAREHEILVLLVEGLGVGAISRRLYISPSTTKTHVANIYAKLGAANRAQAVVTAIREGLVSA